MARIFWDTNLFIYLFEEKQPQVEMVAALRKRMLERGDQLFTSTLTLGELLIMPMRMKLPALEQRYIEFFRSGVVSVLPFDFKSARIFARVREERSIHPPDAIQLSCAAAAETNLFITNDERLTTCNIPGIDFITSLARAPM